MTNQKTCEERIPEELKSRIEKFEEALEKRKNGKK